MIRRFGEAVVSGQKYTHRPGAYVILPRDGQLLLTFEGKGQNEFQLPGGGIDPGESPLQALYREVLEETGWSIAAPRHVATYRRFCYMPDYDKWAEKVCSVYLARPVRQIAEPCEAEHWPVWVPAAEAAEIIASAGDRAVVAALI
jgi:8-oxo-dGTP diphosphatase